MKPIEIRRERDVLVPVDVLWQIVEPAETLASWLPVCERCETLSGRGLGRRQRMVVRWARRQAQIVQEVNDYTPLSRLAWRHVEERFGDHLAPRIASETTMSVELRPAGPTTRVVLTSRHVPANPAAALLLRFVARPRITRAFDRALAQLAGSGVEG